MIEFVGGFEGRKRKRKRKRKHCEFDLRIYINMKTHFPQSGGILQGSIALPFSHFISFHFISQLIFYMPLLSSNFQLLTTHHHASQPILPLFFPSSLYSKVNAYKYIKICNYSDRYYMFYVHYILMALKHAN